MKRTIFSRVLAATVFAAAAIGAVSAAEARPDIQVSIGLPGLPVFLPPPPAYLPPVVYEQGRAPERADFERERGWRQAEWQRRDFERRELERREWQRRELERREWERHEWQRREWERHHLDRPPVYGSGWR